jgi:hypothetical protein
MEGSLRDDGALIVRGFLNRRELTSIAETVDLAFANVDRGEASTPVIENVSGWGGLGLPFMTDAGIPQARVDQVAEMVERRSARSIGRCHVLRDACVFRRMLEARTRVLWHIDADGAGTAPWDPCFNVWIPFVPVGTEQPSIEYVRGSHKMMRNLPALPWNEAARTDEWVAEHFPASDRKAAILAPGDALVFSHWVLHRTQILANPVVRRTSGEFRLTQNPIYMPPAEPGKWTPRRILSRALEALRG